MKSMAVNEQDNQDEEIKLVAAQRAEQRAKAIGWDLDVGVFFFSILCIIVILLFEGIEIEIVAPVAILGLTLGWFMGRRKGKLAYGRFYDDELAKLKYQQIMTPGENVEEIIQEALRKRFGQSP